MTAKEYGAHLASLAAPISPEVAEAAARILAAEPEDAAA